MQEQNLTSETTALVIKDFGLDTQDLKPTENLDDLMRELTRIISYLLDKDFGRLINACYRIDIAESKLKEVLHNAAPDQVAPKLAELILTREHQKAILRKKYSATD